MSFACAQAVIAAPLAPNDPTRALPPAPSSSAPLDVHSGSATGGPQDTTARLVLRAVEFDGAKTVSRKALRAAWSGYVGKQVSLADLRTIGRRAEKIYSDAGYPFVAVVLRVQKVKDGVVHYDTVEGRISDLTVLGKSRTARRQATAALSPLVNHAPLSLADVESAYQDAKDVPGLSVSGTLRAGSQPGGMDLVVATQRDEWRVYANANNLYADPVGPWGVLVGVDHFGASEYGDQASLQVYTSLPVDRQILVRGSDMWRLNDSGTTVTFSALWGQAHPQGNIQQLAIAQDVVSLRADIAQPLWDRPGSKFQVDLALEGSNQKTDVFSNVRLSEDRLRDVSLTFDGEQKGAFGRIAVSGEIHKNIDIIDASTTSSANLSRVGADPEAAIFRSSAEAETPTFEHVRFDIRAEGQYTDQPLTIPDQYSAGNLTIGRGYQPGAALGDRAVGGSAEIRVGPFDVAHKVQLEPFVFADVLDLWNIGFAPFEHRQLSSLGGGVRFQFNGKAHLDLLCAVPQDPPLGIGDRTPSPMVLMNLTVSVSDAFQAIHDKLFPESGK